MSVDTTYIINQFARQKTLQVQMTNMPDTVNVAVTNDSIYSRIIMHIDSLNAQLAQHANPALDNDITDTTFGILSLWGLPLIIALIAMAAPLLLTNINGLDQKYHSTRILDVFKHTCSYQTLIFIGILTAICVVVNFTRWQNSICQIFTVITSFLLLVSIFALCFKLLLFYNYSGLISHFIDRYKSNLVSEAQKNRIYYALIDCTKYAIRQGDNKKMQELLTFFEEDYIANRNSKQNNKSRDFIMEVTEVLCVENKTNIVYQGVNNKYTLPLSIIIPTNRDAFNSKIIDSSSLTTIWDTLLIYLSYNKEELILSYWESAQEYYRHLGYDYSALDNFIAFNEKVGALLLALGRYETLYNIIYWTEKEKTRNVFDLFSMPIFRPDEKLISLDSSDVMLRYIRLMNDIDINSERLCIPHVAATADMKNPLKESAIGYMALLYLLTCKKGEDTTYFYIEEGEDLRLPEKADIETIRKQTNDIVRLAQMLLKNQKIKSIFKHLQELDDVTYPARFIDIVDEYFKIHARIADILPEVYTKIDNLYTHEAEYALSKYILSETNSIHNLKQIDKEIGRICLVAKTEINKKDAKDNAYEDIKNRHFCGIIEGQYNAIEKVKVSQKNTILWQQLIESLDNSIKKLKAKKKYIIFCDDCRGEYIFDNNDNYKNNIYKGVQIYFAPIYKKDCDVCHFVLLKKDNLPTYQIEETGTIQNILGYKFKVIQDNYHQQRLVLDVGRTPDEVYKQLESQIQPQLLPKGKELSEILIIAGYLPICFYAKLRASIDEMWIVNEVPKYKARSYYEQEDDYYERPENPITRAIITPEEHNKNI